jgi:hypothetical protein
MMHTLVFFLALSGVTAINCYDPAGTVLSQWVPCPGTNTKQCCDLGNGDTCTSDGLCLNTNGYTYRDGCTDPTWTDPSCVRLCMCKLPIILQAIERKLTG